MYKRLLALIVVVLISITMAVPALAQEEEEQQQAAMDVSSVFTAEFCPILQQDASVWDLMLSMFPTLAETCAE